MRLERDALKEFVVDAALAKFGNRTFRRAELIECAEEALRRSDLWEGSDDLPSQSADPKSMGRANIDWTISALGSEAKLRHLGHDQWRVPARCWPRMNGLERQGANGHRLPTSVEDRLRRLEDATARVHGAPVPLQVLRREELYRDRP